MTLVVSVDDYWIMGTSEGVRVFKILVWLFIPCKEANTERKTWLASVIDMKDVVMWRCCRLILPLWSYKMSIMH